MGPNIYAHTLLPPNDFIQGDIYLKLVTFKQLALISPTSEKSHIIRLELNLTSFV